MAGVLFSADLPSEPSQRRVVESPRDLTPYCDVTNEAFWKQSWLDSEVVEFRGVGNADVISAAYRAGDNQYDDSTPEEQLAVFKDSWGRCPEALPEVERKKLLDQFPDLGGVEGLDLGPGRFGYRATEKDGSLLGIQGFAVAGATTVQVSIYPSDGDEVGMDLSDLLDRAVARVNESDRP